MLLAAALFVRRLLIRYIGNDVNGLNSLYANIIGILAVAELGIGSAIVYSMYRPIIEGDDRQLAALYCLYKKIYRIIGAIILGGGLLVMPFLPLLISDYGSVHVNVYGSFFLTLISVVVSYFYSARISLIEAHKNNYIATGIMTVSGLIKYGFQIAAILVCKSYTAFLVCQIVETIAVWFLTGTVVRMRYGNIIDMQEDVEEPVMQEIIRNVKAMIMHKIGTILVNSVDSMIISAFIGVIALGKYTNYSLVAGAVAGIIGLFFTPLTSVIGHMYVSGSPDQAENYFHHFFYLNYLLGLVFFLGYYAVADNVITLCFGTGLKLPRGIVFVISLNQYTMFMRKSSLLFRDASGSFYHDRWKPVLEGIVNLILSLLFVRTFPENYRIVGVIAATIITTLVICDIVEPYVVYHHVFQKSPRRFYLRLYFCIGLFVAGLFIMEAIRWSCGNDFIEFLINGLMSVIVSLIVLGLSFLSDKSFRRELIYAISFIRSTV